MSKFVAQLFSIEGKTALVTGGSRGIGAEIAMSFKKAGANLVCLSRSSVPKNIELQDNYYQCDISDSSNFDKICSQTAEEFGSIDIFVNAAGVTMPADNQARHYFCESLFWASQPKQAAKITWQLMPSAPRFVLRPCHCVTSLQARC